MNARAQYTPLTEEEQRFAAENHHIIGQYLGSRKLPADEWYDVVVFRYLLSVKKWFAQPELHKYKFRTVACMAMRSAIGAELEKQSRRIHADSLDAVLPGTEDFTLHETVTAENLNYLYIGGEKMQVKYNVRLPEPRQRAWQKSDEVIALEGFLVGKMGNMCFEYETLEEAKKKMAHIRAYQKKKQHEGIYDYYRVEKCIYIVRK